MKSLLAVSFLIVLLMASLVAVGQSSDQSSIEIGVARLRLGMSQEDTLAALRKERYFVQEQANKDGLLVFLNDKSPFDPIGNVNFKNGKLDSVYKYWGPTDQRPGVALSEALYKAVSAVTENAKKLCAISVGQQTNQLAQIQTTFIVCGARSIHVTIVKRADGDSASVTEVLTTNPQ